MRLTTQTCQKKNCNNTIRAGFRLCGQKGCGEKKECEHLDYRDTLTGAVCNDCGKEEE